MSKSKFYDKIKIATEERQVEDVYNEGINLYFKSDITYPFDCDGLIDTKTENGKILKLIIEYKFDELLKSSTARAKVLCQVVFYLKKFEDNGERLPNVCMVGDKNECFVIHTNDLLGYLDEDVDWTIAPSKAHKLYPELVAKIASNENINPFIFEVDENFSFKEMVYKKIVELADNVKRYVRVTEHNIATIYDYFVRNVVKDAKKIQPNDLVAIFMGVITDHENYFKHPQKKNILCTPTSEIGIDAKSFDSFFSYFERKYTPQEKNKFAEISDRLIEDTKRRHTGEFYTPTLFVDYAHKMLAENFGEDWKENYVVWDNCCGTKNLTRDYRFKELYCSTLENAELEISKRYNPEAVSFQFDFLNDSLDKAPEGLKRAIKENKPIIFLINPPYATSGNWTKEKKKGVAKTKVNEEMLANKIGASSQNLYAQFLYRISDLKKKYNLTNVHIGLFSPTLFLTGTSWKGFRNYFFNEFNFADGVQFKASHFADVADSWGISFSIWNCGVCENKNEFNYKLIDNIDGEIQIIDKKSVYNIDKEKSASDWAKESIKQLKTYDGVALSSGVKIKDRDNNSGRIFNNALGYIFNKSNNVDSNAMNVALFSCTYFDGHGHGINESNFIKCTALFSARKLIEKTWINSKDEYLAPNENHPAYKEFENDSIIYSIFNNASNQSSLRNVEYKGKKWDIKNEFFFMSKDEMSELANENYNDDCYNDSYTATDRYVYTLLKETELSEEATAVLNKAKDIIRKTFKYRNLFNEEHPEYQINNWDCGWYQIKALAKEYAPADLKEFNELYKKLADKMRPMVYELGFLK